jgi:hypothetical protein
VPPSWCPAVQLKNREIDSTITLYTIVIRHVSSYGNIYERLNHVIIITVFFLRSQCRGLSSRTSV